MLTGQLAGARRWKSRGIHLNSLFRMSRNQKPPLSSLEQCLCGVDGVLMKCAGPGGTAGGGKRHVWPTDLWKSLVLFWHPSSTAPQSPIIVSIGLIGGEMNESIARLTGSVGDLRELKETS